MPPSTLTFSCPECATRLSVDADLAGVIGPCPSCHASIQAPLLNAPDVADGDVLTEMPAMDEAAEAMPAMPPTEGCELPKIITKPPSVATAEAVVEQTELVLEDAPAVEEVADAATLGASLDQAQLDDEPSGITARTALAPGPEVQVPAQQAGPMSWYRRPWVLGVALVALMMGFFVMDSVRLMGAKGGADEVVEKQPVKEARSVADEGARKAPPVLVRKPKLPESQTGQETADAVLVKKVVVQPALPPHYPEFLYSTADEEKYLGMRAQDLLQAFLSAATLRDRWPTMMTESTPEVLMETCLSKPLPEVVSLQLDYMDAHPEHGHTDCFFSVAFKGSGDAQDSHTVVVREREGRSPRVLADPFVDLYGGRLREFVRKPHQGNGVFQVVVSASAGCKDRTVPQSNRKLTLKLLARDHGKEIGRAYFNKGGSVAALLEDGTFRLSYGNPTACRVYLQWNYHEDAQNPYLEAVAIRDFGWGRE